MSDELLAWASRPRGGNFRRFEQRSARRLARLLLRDEARALGALDPTPAPLTQLFGAQTFARCNAIVASRRRRRDRQTRRDTS